MNNRPSFLASAPPDLAEPLYETFCAALSAELGKPCARGTFGADMQVSLCNDGPITLWLDTALKNDPLTGRQSLFRIETGASLASIVRTA